MDDSRDDAEVNVEEYLNSRKKVNIFGDMTSVKVKTRNAFEFGPDFGWTNHAFHPFSTSYDPRVKESKVYQVGGWHI